MTKLEYPTQPLWFSLKPYFFNEVFLFKHRLVLFYFYSLLLVQLLLQVGCQTRSTVDSPLKGTPTSPPQSAVKTDSTLATANMTVHPGGDPWFTTARLGDWAQLEKMQKETGRAWDYQHPNGQTALMMAARNGQIDFVKNLINKKVKINLTDRYGYNALSYTLHGPQSIEVKKTMCQLLVENGADPFQEDQFKLSPILVMIENGFSACIHIVKLTDIRPCDQVSRLSEVTSLVTYADKEEEFEIRDYFKSKGCQ